MSGLPSFIPTIVHGFSESITASEYAPTSFLDTFSIVDFRFPSKSDSTSLAITSVSV